MARQARQISKSGNYYIVLKGSELFVTDEDKERFLEILAEKLDGGKIHSVEITKNEIRMVVKESSAGISMNMKSVTTVYARYFNRVNNREGKLFEGRFKSEPLETKKEIEEYSANLKNAKAPAQKQAKAAPKARKIEPKKAAAKPTPKPKKTEEKKEEVKSVPKKNLPSWLL